MAFMTSTGNGSTDASGERLPVLKYDARAGRLFTLDRVQTNDGWETNQIDVTLQQPAFAIDFGTLETGWSHFAAGAAPMWAVAPFGSPAPARPASPGADDKGKVIQFKSAFRVRVCGSAIGGVREFGGNSGALINGMNDIHTAFEAASEAAAGKIPVVKMVNTLAIKSGQSTNYQPVFAIQQWVDRPDALGRRTVPPPTASTPKPATSPTPATYGASHVPPPAAVMPPPAAAAPANAMPF